MNRLTSISHPTRPQPSSYNKVAFRLPLSYMGSGLVADVWQPSVPKTVRFGQNYTADVTTLSAIQQALSGGNASQWAPSYQSSPAITQAVAEMLENPNTVAPEAAVTELTQALALARNTRALVQGKPVQPQSAFEAEARQFFAQVAREGADMVKTLEDLKLPAEAVTLSKAWIAKTAPMLQLMGFNDAIPHASQVARLATIRSAQRGESAETILTSMLVGWIHDPKLPDTFENLATHPVVASSIVAQAFTEDAGLKTKLEAALKALGGSGASQVISAMSDAAGINNDSGWVNQNVILNRMPQKGVSVDGLKETFWQRFQSLSTEQTPNALAPTQLSELTQATFDTGIYLFNKAALDGVLQATGQNNGLASLLVTDVPQQQVLSEISQQLKAANAVESLSVPAVGLLNNSEALGDPLAKSVARNLAEADNSLLSPHKIVMTSKAGNVVARMASFLESFEENVNALPPSFRDRARQWQVDLTRSIVQGLESLMQRPLFQAAWEHAPVAEKIQKMTQMILDPASWVKGGPNGLDYGKLDDNAAPLAEVATQRQQVQEVAAALQKTYTQSLLESPVMFRLK